LLNNDFVPRLEARHEFTRCLELNFDFFRGRTICVEPVEEALSTDGGLLVLRQFDEQHGLTSEFAEQLLDPRRRSDPFVFGDGSQSRVWNSGRVRRSERTMISA